MSTTAKLIELAGRHFGVDTTGFVGADDFFERLGIDSVRALELLTELEMEFDVEIPDYEIQGIHTFDELARVIDRRR